MSKTFIKNTKTNIEGVEIASDGTITLPATTTIDGVDLGVFKADYDGKVNQDVRSTASPTFAAITVPTITPAGVGLSVSTTGSTFGGNKYTLLLKDTNPLAANNGSGIIFGAIATGSTVSPDLGSIRINKDNSTDGHYGYSLQFYNSTSSGTLTKHMEISSSGAVTLGPAAGGVTHTLIGAATLLDGSAGSHDLYLRCLATGQANINLGTSASPSEGKILYSTNSHEMKFTANSIESLALSSTGAVTLGPDAGGVTHRLNTNTTAASTGSLTLTNAPTGKSGNPAGYITININGTDRVIPYW